MVLLLKVLLVGCLVRFLLMAPGAVWNVWRLEFSLGADSVLPETNNHRVLTGDGVYLACPRHVGLRKLVKRDFRGVDDGEEYHARRRDC